MWLERASTSCIFLYFLVVVSQVPACQTCNARRKAHDQACHAHVAQVHVVEAQKSGEAQAAAGAWPSAGLPPKAMA